MKPAPETLVAAAADKIATISVRFSAARALLAVAAAANIDAGQLAEALVLTGVTQLGPFNFAPLPNDLAVIQAVKNNDPRAREYIFYENRRRPLGHVASILRCSSTWVRAALEHWGLQPWPDNRQAAEVLPEELRLEETCTPLALRDLITDAVRASKGVPSEAAWRLGVSHRWLMHQLKVNGLSQGPAPMAGKTPALRLGHNCEATKEERVAIKQRITALGSVSAWAREVGLAYSTAVKQAKAVGYSRARGGLPAKAVLERLRRWVAKTGYDGTTNGVGSPWLAKNVLLVDANEFDKVRVQKAMKKLGFKAYRRSSAYDWVWLRSEKEVDRNSETFQYRDADKSPKGIWDLSHSKREERKRVRKALLTGELAPTPELLEIAGLQLK